MRSWRAVTSINRPARTIDLDRIDTQEMIGGLHEDARESEIRLALKHVQKHPGLNEHFLIGAFLDWSFSYRPARQQ